MASKAESGITILVFIVWISSCMMLCMALWRTTAYMVDLAAQKQRYIENYYYAQGIMRWATKWVDRAWNNLQLELVGNDFKEYVLTGWPAACDRLTKHSPILRLTKQGDDTFGLKVLLPLDTGIFAIACQVCRHAHADGAYTTNVHGWHIEQA